MKRSTANVSKISGLSAVFVWPNEGVIISREYLALEPRMPMAILRMLATTLLVFSTLLQLLLARQPTSLLGESVQKAVLAPDGISLDIFTTTFELKQIIYQVSFQKDFSSSPVNTHTKLICAEF